MTSNDSSSSSSEGDTKNSAQTNKKDKKKEKRKKTKWSAAEDAELVSVLREQQKLGNQADSGWKPIVWTKVVEALMKNHLSLIPKMNKQASTRFGNVR